MRRVAPGFWQILWIHGQAMGTGWPLVCPQHAVDQVTQGAPEILPARQVVLIDEQDVVLEAGVEVGFQAQLHNDRVMVTVYVCIDSI